MLLLFGHLASGRHDVSYVEMFVALGKNTKGEDNEIFSC